VRIDSLTGKGAGEADSFNAVNYDDLCSLTGPPDCRADK